MSAVGDVLARSRASTATAGRGRLAEVLGRRRLPSGRSALGALLVVAARGSASTSPTNEPRPSPRPGGSWRRDPSRPGHVVIAADLGVAPMRLPGSTADQAFTDPDDLIGTRALQAIGDGELIQRSDLAELGAAPRSAPIDR